MPDADAPTQIAAIPFDKHHVRVSAELFESLGTPRFPLALKQYIRLFCDFDSMIATRYPADEPPLSIFQDLDDVQAAISVQFYATGPYLLDPLYQACRGGRDPGVYRTLDLAPEAFFRSEYYRTFYRNTRVSDEIGLLIRERGQNWIIVSLARLVHQARFTQQEVDSVQNVFPVLSAAVLKNWGAMPAEEQQEDTQLLEDKLDNFGKDVLSPRQAEIVRLILQGHSTPSAAAYLGISEGTVKVHRHHAYSKLGISSQAELFSMATRYFIAPTS